MFILFCEKCESNKVNETSIKFVVVNWLFGSNDWS